MGGFKLNLDNVEPWKASGVILGPGEHIVQVVEEEVITDGDHPEVELSLEAVAGDEQGGSIRDWVHVTEKSLGRVAQVLKAFEVEIPEGDFEWPGVKGKRAKIIVRREPKRNEPDRMVTVVKGYAPLTDTDKVAAEFNATEAKGGDPGPEAGKPKPEDDIPF